MALPALNEPAIDGVEMERVWVTLPKETVARVDDYFHARRLKNRPAAIRELIENGLRTAAWKR